MMNEDINTSRTTGTQQIATAKGLQLSRREFLEVTGTVAAIAGLSITVSRFPMQLEKVEAQAQATNPQEQVMLTTCRICSVYDGIQVHVVNGQPTFIEGNPRDPQSYGHVCAKGNAGIYQHYDPYRLLNPVKRTSAKGMYQTGNWVEITWDEAYSTIAAKIQAARSKGASGIVDYRSYSATSWSQTWSAFQSSAPGQNQDYALDMNWCGHIMHFLGRAAHNAFAQTIDFAHCNYYISPGSATGAKALGNFMPLAQELADARARGMKWVNVEPYQSVHGALADEWIPIAPGTDGPFADAMLEVLLVELKQYDTAFLKASTNAPYLIGSDGLYVRDAATNKPLVWDPVDTTAKTYDDATVKDFAILGSFTVNGVQCNPGFQLLVNAVTSMTPEWASPITGIPAATIRRIATEFVTAAQIGATINIGGKTYPLRPAATDGSQSNAANHVHGFANQMSWQLLNTVIGAQDAPGGNRNRGGTAYVRPGPDGMIELPVGAYTMVKNPPYKFAFPPTHADLREFFPVGDHLGDVTFVTMNDPTNYWNVGKISYDFIMIHAGNPVLSMFDAPKMEAVMKAAGFTTDVCIQIDETAEAFADIVLPDRCYLEEYQLLGGSLMQPVTTPPNNIPYFHDTLTQIASKAGFLGAYNGALNKNLKTNYQFDTTQPIAISDYMDRLLKSTYGDTKGLTWFQQNGQVKNPISAQEPIQPWKYNLTPSRRIPVYFESIVEVKTALKKNLDANGVQWDYQDYAAVPTWIPSHIYQDTPPYDLTLITYLNNSQTYTFTNQSPIVTEIELADPHAPYVVMHPDAAAARGIAEGDHIWVESNIGKLEGVAHISETVHPKAIAVNRTMGGWARNSVVKNLYKENLGLAFQTIRPAEMDYIDRMTAALENLIKVRVYKAT